MGEVWKDIFGYEGWYQISSLRRVKRIKPGHGARIGYILESFRAGDYLAVNLSKNGRTKIVYIHTLVLEAFVSPRPPGCECNHKNGDKSDNRIENLEWMTRSENVQHSYRVLGRRYSGVGKGVDQKGENNGNVKLTEEKVLKIRKLYETGEYTCKRLGKMFSCSDSNIHIIVTRRTWKYI